MDSLDDLLASLPSTAYRPKDDGPKPAPKTGAASAIQVFNYLASRAVKQDLAAFMNLGGEPGLLPVPCEDINLIIEKLTKKNKLSKPMIDTFITAFAAAISLDIPGPFIWCHIAGPSSGSKTVFLDLIATAADKVFSTNDFTSFYSGSTVGGKNNSLLANVQGRIFIIRDLTPLLQSKADVQNTVFGQWRAIYDGTGEKFYNNGVVYDFKNVRFVALTGVTYEIYKFSRTDLGERFLICDISSEWTQDGRLVKIETDLEADGNACDNIFSTIEGTIGRNDAPKIDQLDEERRMCWGFLNHLFEYISYNSDGIRDIVRAFSVDRTVKSQIDGLAVWLEHARCPVPPKYESVIRPTPAEPHRSIKQLGKLAICLAIVTKATGPTEQIRELLRKVAFDTGRSYSMEIMNYLASYPRSTRQILASKMQLSTPHIGRLCEHLISLRVIEIAHMKMSSGPGQPSMVYSLTPKFRDIADTIGLPEIDIRPRSYGGTPSADLDDSSPGTPGTDTLTALLDGLRPEGRSKF